MSEGRRQFTDEFKREAVALLASSGRPLLQIAGELGISPSMLRNWRNRSEGRNAGSALRLIPAPTPHSAPDSALEISRLRRENDRLRMERDILKNSSRGFVPPVAVETGALAWPWRGAAVSFMVAMTPSKNVAPGLLRT
jgi:transposase